MPNIERLRENLLCRGYDVSCFETSQQANQYLVEKLRGKTIGMGGLMTAKDMGLPELLKTVGSRLIWIWEEGDLQEAACAPIYLSSVNGAAESGELINIDGIGNRVSSTCYGHEELYLIFGMNKVEETFEKALWRARNIAAPKNAQRLNKKTPCAVKGDRCYNCNSPDRICKVLNVLWGPPKGFRRVEVIIVNEVLGF